MNATAKKRPKKSAKKNPKPAATPTDAASGALQEASLASQLATKPKRRTLLDWVTENGFGTIWKSVPKPVRKELSRNFRIVEAAKTIGPRLEAAKKKYDDLLAIAQGAEPAQKLIEEKMELLRSFNRTLFNGLHIPADKQIDVNAPVEPPAAT